MLPQSEAVLTSVKPTALAFCQRKEGRKEAVKKGGKKGKEGRERSREGEPL